MISSSFLKEASKLTVFFSLMVRFILLPACKCQRQGRQDNLVLFLSSQHQSVFQKLECSHRMVEVAKALWKLYSLYVNSFSMRICVLCTLLKYRINFSASPLQFCHALWHLLILCSPFRCASRLILSTQLSLHLFSCCVSPGTECVVHS